MSEQTKAQRIAASAKAVAGRRRPGDRAETVTPANANIAAPTDEQRPRFTEKPVPVRTEKGQVVGRAYRRQPYFVTLAKLPADRAQPKGRRLLTAEEFRALRFYRSAWESSQSSPMKCALDVRVRGELGNNREIVPGDLWHAAQVRTCEQAVGAIADTLRAVALDDLTFADVAMRRWGSRERSRIVIGKGKEKPRHVAEIVPRSSAHPEIVKREFLDAVSRLAQAVGRHALLID